MKRNAGALLFIFIAGGCLSVDNGPQTVGGLHSKFGKGYRQPTVPGVVGPYGQTVPMKAPYNAAPPTGERMAIAMMSRSMPGHMVQNSPSGPLPMNMPMPGGAPPPHMMAPPGGLISPIGMPFAPGVGGQNPIQQAQFRPTTNGPGMPGMPGMPPLGMPGPGMPGMPPPGMAGPGMPGMPGMPPPGMGKMPAGAVAAFGANIGQHSPMQFSVKRTQVRFVEPVGMKVSWFTQSPTGQPSYSPLPIETPGRYNFAQAAIYRLKLTNIKYYPNMPPIYPTLEVVPANINTATFLAHSPVPIQFTKEEFDQVVRGNFLVKVIYLPHPRFQELAGAGPDQILSTQLEPGLDPIKEATRRGDILLVIRMGGIDQEAPNTPSIAAPGPQGMMPPPGMMPHHGQPGPMVPYFGLPPGTPLVGPGGKMLPPPPGMAIPGPVGAPPQQPVSRPTGNALKTSQPRTDVPPNLGQQPVNAPQSFGQPPAGDNFRIPESQIPVDRGVREPTPPIANERPPTRPILPPVPPRPSQVPAPGDGQANPPGSDTLELPMIP